MLANPVQPKIIGETAKTGQIKSTDLNSFSWTGSNKVNTRDTSAILHFDKERACLELQIRKQSNNAPFMAKSMI